jgi:hypothetical protein
MALGWGIATAQELEPMRRIATLSFIVGSAAALAACGSSGPKSEEQVKQEISKIERPMPGQYKSSIKITKFEIPGLGQKEAEAFKGLMSGTAQTRTYCVSKEESDQGFKEMTKQFEKGKCNYDRFDATGGRLDAKMTCETGKGMSSTIEISGTTTSEGSNMVLKMQNSAPAGTNAFGPGAMGNANIEMEVSNARIGDCPA